MTDDRIPALNAKTAWVVANDADGSLELSTEGAPGAQLMTDDRIPALKSALAVVARKKIAYTKGPVPQLYEYMKTHNWEKGAPKSHIF